MAAKGYQNVGRLRRKLRRITKATENGIRPVMEKLASDIALDMRGLTPVDTGTAVTNIDHKLSADGLSAKIGIRTPTRAREAFYFRFLDMGTKGSPEKNIPPMQALHIRERAYDANKDAGMRQIREAINAQLRKVCHE